MARAPKDDPRVADLARYRKARARAAKAPPPRPSGHSQSFLGGRPRAGLILAAVIVVFLLLTFGPRLMAS